MIHLSFENHQLLVDKNLYLEQLFNILNLRQASYLYLNISNRVVSTKIRISDLKIKNGEIISYCN